MKRGERYNKMQTSDEKYTSNSTTVTYLKKKEVKQGAVVAEKAFHRDYKSPASKHRLSE